MGNAVYPFFKSCLPNGVTPNVNGRVWCYAAGTTNLLNTYSNAALTLPYLNANPVPLNAIGEATIFLQAAAYRLEIFDQYGALISTFEPVVGIGSGAGTPLNIVSTIRGTSNSIESQAPPASQTLMFAAGYAQAGDLGGGTFLWDAGAASLADDGGTVIAPLTASSGRWRRLDTQPISLRMFGWTGSGGATDTTAITNYKAWLNAGGNPMYQPNSKKPQVFNMFGRMEVTTQSNGEPSFGGMAGLPGMNVRDTNLDTTSTSPLFGLSMYKAYGNGSDLYIGGVFASTQQSSNQVWLDVGSGGISLTQGQGSSRIADFNPSAPSRIYNLAGSGLRVVTADAQGFLYANSSAVSGSGSTDYLTYWQSGTILNFTNIKRIGNNHELQDGVFMMRNSTSSLIPGVSTYYSRGTRTSPIILQANDAIMTNSYFGYDGVQDRLLSYIQVALPEAPVSGQYPSSAMTIATSLLNNTSVGKVVIDTFKQVSGENIGVGISDGWFNYGAGTMQRPEAMLHLYAQDISRSATIMLTQLASTGGTTAGGRLRFRRASGFNTPTDALAGYETSRINVEPWSGSGYVSTAYIRSYIPDTTVSGQLPSSAWEIATNPTNVGPLARLVIGAYGRIAISASYPVNSGNADGAIQISPSAVKAGIFLGNFSNTATNVLDWYEEGTWTPQILAGGSNTGFAGTFYGQYTRIGNTVSVHGRLQLTSRPNVATVLSVVGFPYVPSFAGQGGSVNYNHKILIGAQINGAPLVSPLTMYNTASAAEFFLYMIQGFGVSAHFESGQLRSSDIFDDSQFNFNFTYFTAS